jgi:flagellar basal-body rod protein FlgC
MSMMKVFDVAGSAVSAQSQRLNVVSSNLANAESVAGPDGKPYQVRQVVFATRPTGDPAAAGVRVTGIVTDQTPGKRVHDPKHPMADAEGYVTAANVNVEEMVNMISASRSYQTNVEVMNTAKTLLLKTLRAIALLALTACVATAHAAEIDEGALRSFVERQVGDSGRVEVTINQPNSRGKY